MPTLSRATTIGARVLGVALLFALFSSACERAALRFDATRKLHRHTVVNLVATAASMLHCLLALSATIWLFASLTDDGAPADNPAGMLGLRLHTHVPTHRIDAAGCLFLGFLVFDSLFVIRHFHVKGIGSYAFLIHHFAFIVACCLNMDAQLCNYIFPVLYAGEFSTVFLNLRVIVRAFDRPDFAVSAAFLVAFFLSRVVLMGLAVGQLVSLRASLYVLLDPYVLFSYLCVVPCLYLLNLYWFAKICRSALCVLIGVKVD